MRPPNATLARRAQSYSDFHDAVKAVLGPEPNQKGSEEGRKSRGKLRRSSHGSKIIEERGITSELEFIEWYDTLENELLDSSHDDYQLYQKQLTLSQSHLDSLLSDTSTTLDLLASLTTSFKEVEAQTTEFQRQCEGLLDEQKRIEALANDVDRSLNFYNYLEPVTRRLNAPGAGNFVRSKEFSEMLTRIDECLIYMAAHVGLFLRAQDFSLTKIAKSSRSSYIQITISLIDDKRPDTYSGTLCKRTQRDSF